MYRNLQASKYFPLLSWLLALLIGGFLLLGMRSLPSSQISLPVNHHDPLAATNTVILHDQQGKYPLGKHLEISVDPTQKLTITDVTQPQQQFTPSHVDVPNMGFSHAAYWARVTLRNHSHLTSQWYLQGAPSNVDQVELYIPQGNSWIKKQIGRKLPFSQRELQDRNLVFFLPIGFAEEKTIYLRFISQGTIAMKVIAWQPATYYNNNFTSQFLLGGFYGILLTLVFINLLLVLLLDDVSYRYYVFSLIGMTANSFIRDGFALQYLWPDFPQLNLTAAIIFIGIALANSSSFFITFLQVRRYSHQLYRLMNWVRWVCVGFMLMGWSLPFQTSIILGQYLAIILCFLMSYACLYTWHKGFVPARFALWGWSCLFVGTSIWCFKSFGWLPANVLTEELQRFGVIGLVFFIAIALGDHVNLIKKASKQIESEQQKLALIVENSSEFISINQFNGQSIFINDAGKKIIGLSAATDFKNINILDYLYPDDRYLFQSDILKNVQTKGRWEGEIRLCNGNNGAAIYTISSFFLIKDQQTGEPRALASVSRDISKLKQAEHNILQALESEKAVNQMRSRFITMASHEIRTPLAIISSSTGILQNFSDRLTPEKKQGHLDTIQATIKRMTQLLDDVLMINRVETQNIEFQPESLDIIAFCRSLSTEVATTTHTIDFSCDLDSQMSDGSLIVQCDQTLLWQILTHILNNAIKYSPHHQMVQLNLTTENQQLIFKISDRGIGIPPAEQSNIYDDFQRGSNVGNISGTGLGLSIVKKYLELHHGEIQLDSYPGKGTTVTVRIPYVKFELPKHN
jgi:PAS domain S-box-containing protein